MNYNAELLSLAPDELSELVSELSFSDQVMFDQLYDAFVSNPTQAGKDQIYDLLGLVTDEEFNQVLESGEVEMTMLSEKEYGARVEMLISEGMDERMARIKAVLEHGLACNAISSAEANTAIAALQTFLTSHPDYQFHSGSEKKANSSADEVQLWNTIQPILDKAQGIRTNTLESRNDRNG